MSDLCGPDGRLLHASAEAERKLLIQLLTKEEKEFTETITKMCALRTAIAQGAKPDDLTLEQCTLMSSVMAYNANEVMQGWPEDEQPLEHTRTVLHASTLSAMALRWLNIAQTKVAKGGQG
jgi:hypothetical protein